MQDDKTEKTLYTCPMDPDVITDKPGTCPKCGMTLVSAKDSRENQMKCKCCN